MSGNECPVQSFESRMDVNTPTDESDGERIKTTGPIVYNVVRVLAKGSAPAEREPEQQRPIKSSDPTERLLLIMSVFNKLL